MILLDSSILIDLFRKKNKKNSAFYKLLTERSEFAISVVTYYEIGTGNKKSNSDFWNKLYNNLTIIPFDQGCSDTAIEIYLNLKKRNKIIEVADLWIGATALTHGMTLATLNKKHFERIKNLKVI